MDYLKHTKRNTISRDDLIFIRCDKDGNIIPEDSLKNLGITNSTIERIVSDVAGRLSSGSADGEVMFSEGIITN